MVTSEHISSTPSPVSQSLDFAHGPTWAHRIALAPLTNQQSGNDGILGEDELAWLTQRARGGFAAVSTCAAHVAPEGQTFSGQLGIWDDKHLPGLSRLADALHSAGTIASTQLQHGGRRADPALSGLPRVSSWADPDAGVSSLSTVEVNTVIADFTAAARRAERAGFDGVEVHAAHGYLLAQFFDPRTHGRTDRYGGSLQGGFRLLQEVLGAIRAATTSDLQLGVRLSPERSGMNLSEAKDIAEQLMISGTVDYLDLSLWDAFKQPHDEKYRETPLLEHFTTLSRGTSRLGVAGRIDSGAAAADCLNRGADFVMVGTAGILEHDFADRVLKNPQHVAVSQPTTREHLATQAVGPAFIEYLATGWTDFVV